jgi:hypothetical protein
MVTTIKLRYLLQSVLISGNLDNQRYRSSYDYYVHVCYRVFLTRFCTCPSLLRIHVLLYLQRVTSLKYSFLGASAKLRRASITFFISLRRVSPFVCPSAWKKSAPPGQIITKLDIFIYFENLILLKSDKYNGYFMCRHKHIYDSISLTYS